MSSVTKLHVLINIDKNSFKNKIFGRRHWQCNKRSKILFMNCSFQREKTKEIIIKGVYMWNRYN